MQPMLVLTGDYTKALAIYAISRIKTLEFDQDFEMPKASFLADTMPRWPRSHDKYYADRGMNWPDRWLFEKASC